MGKMQLWVYMGITQLLIIVSVSLRAGNNFLVNNLTVIVILTLTSENIYFISNWALSNHPMCSLF